MGYPTAAAPVPPTVLPEGEGAAGTKRAPGLAEEWRTCPLRRMFDDGAGFKGGDME